jgi:hypothetical protein
MMPPDTDLKTHLRNLRSLEEARAAYLERSRNHQPQQQSNFCDFVELRDALAGLRKEFAPPPAEEMIAPDTAWRRVLALVRAAKRNRMR